MGTYGEIVNHPPLAKLSMDERLRPSLDQLFPKKFGLVQHFKVDDTRIKTIGLGKSSNAPDGGTVEVLVYPEGTKAPDGKTGAQKTAN